MRTITLIFFSVLFSGVFLSPHQRSSNDSNIWALLIAGSKGWHNYRHQADVCHAYQVLHNHGIPNERIVVMMYGDIAYNPRNPTPGMIFNRPRGPNVRKGVPLDYTGSQVTPENFMSVLKGDKDAVSGIGSEKVINSGPNDHVFLYYSDHGNVGILGFPNAQLTARDLNNTIWSMYKNNKYKEMVIYIEACYSGSLFKDILPNNINVFATTAANHRESSYACYCDDYVLGTCLGDQYSVNWLEDSDKQNLTIETLKEQFELVKKETTRSHVQKFGDESISKLAVGEFQGLGQASSVSHNALPDDDAVRSLDVPLEILRRKIAHGGTPAELRAWQRSLDKMIANRKFLSNKVKAVVDNLALENPSISELWGKHSQLKNFDCYDDVRKYFDEECFKLSENEFALDFMPMLVNLCEHGVSSAKIKTAMKLVCTHPPTCGIH